MVLVALAVLLLFRPAKPWTRDKAVTLLVFAAACDALTFWLAPRYGWNPLHPGAPTWHDPHPVPQYHLPKNWGGS